MRAFVLAAMALMGLLATSPHDLLAQGGPPLGVQGRQDLAFGQLLGGVSERVDPLNAVQAGQFRFRAANRTVEIRFVLPGSLNGPGGGSVPLVFGVGDGAYDLDQGGATVFFDPSQPQTVTPTSPWAWLYLGGTAQPPTQVPSGAYSGTITLTIADLGS